MIQFQTLRDIIESLDYHVQPHFKMYEFFKTSFPTMQVHPCYLHPTIATNLCNTINLCERLREQINEPLIINSGYRPASLNAAVGGVPFSLHGYGTAFDVKVTSPSFSSKFLFAVEAFQKDSFLRKQFPSLKCLVYPTYLHVQYSSSTDYKKFLSKNRQFTIVPPFNKFTYDETTKNLTLDTCYPTDCN